MPAPFGNRFLDTLDAEDLAVVGPLLSVTAVTLGQIVVDQDAMVEEVHFPIDSQFANQVRLPEGLAIETAVVGCEGMTGLAPFMANTPSGWEVVARAAGQAYRGKAAALRGAMETRPRLMRRLLMLTDLYQAQAAQTAACNAAHSTMQRAARWLLTAQDLCAAERIAFTQEELARMLGAQRTTINGIARELKDAGLVDYQRGSVWIIDRQRLKSRACSCYTVLRDRIEGLGLGAPV